MPNWKDLNPRVGGAYDLFGNGRTAVKASIGRYVGKMSTAVATANNPINTSINTVNALVGPTPIGNYVPDCDLQNFNRQRRVRSDQQFQLRPAEPERRALRRRPDSRLGHARLPVGPHDGSAAPADAPHLHQGRVEPQLDDAVR